MPRTCADCGLDISELHGLRKRCESCAPRKVDERRRYIRRPKVEWSCEACGSNFETHMRTRRWCSDACRQTTRMRPCSVCAKPVHVSRTSAAVQTCLDCRRSKAAAARPTLEVWSCAQCGRECQRTPTKGQRPRYCSGCRTRDWIAPARRLALYERDMWTCWLCEEPVDGALIGTRSPWRPSLDHVTPRSKGGSHDDDNLRLAHQWCNSVRSDDKYAPEDFRVSA
jgi:hypothetical protein